jgi:hypothetical protein
MSDQGDVVTVTGIPTSIDVPQVPIQGDPNGAYEAVDIFNNLVITDTNPHALLGVVIYVDGDGDFNFGTGFVKVQFSPDAGDYWITTQSVTPAQLTAMFRSATFTPGGHENRELNSVFTYGTIFEGQPQPGPVVESFVAPSNVPSANLPLPINEIPFDPNGVTLSNTYTGGTIVDGSTSHPLSGFSVTDSNATSGVAITETANIRIFYGSAELSQDIAGPALSLSATSPGALTAALQRFTYTAPNPETGSTTQFQVSEEDSFGAGSSYAFNVPNEPPSPPVPPLSPPSVTEVTQFYQDILQRSPDPGGLAYWTGQINSGALSAAAVEQNVINSSEAQDYVVPIVEMYAILGRAPDQGGLNGWVHALEGGASLPGIALAFISSPEGQGIYGAVPSAASSAPVDTAFTTDLYKEVLGRAPDAGGLSWWVTQLQDGLPAQYETLDFMYSLEAQHRFFAGSDPMNSWLRAAGNGTFASHFSFGTS